MLIVSITMTLVRHLGDYRLLEVDTCRKKSVTQKCQALVELMATCLGACAGADTNTATFWQNSARVCVLTRGGSGRCGGRVVIGSQRNISDI